MTSLTTNALLFSLLTCLSSCFSDFFEPTLLEGNTTTTSRPTPVEDACKAFFKHYIRYAGDFTQCELEHAKPFRMCRNCIEQYSITYATFNDLMNEGALIKCQKKFMKSDRVQIIPTLQENIHFIWEDADCDACFEKNITVDSHTMTVNYTVPPDVDTFLTLYNNLSTCMNVSLELDLGIRNKSSVCLDCKIQYKKLNDHYIEMSSDRGEHVCMDIVDRINYTRLIWTKTFHCSHRSGNIAPPAVVISLVALSPLLYYTILRIFCKEKGKRLMKQKRLSRSAAQDSNSMRYGSMNSRSANRLLSFP